MHSSLGILPHSIIADRRLLSFYIIIHNRKMQWHRSWPIHLSSEPMWRCGIRKKSTFDETTHAHTHTSLIIIIMFRWQTANAHTRASGTRILAHLHGTRDSYIHIWRCRTRALARARNNNKNNLLDLMFVSLFLGERSSAVRIHCIVFASHAREPTCIANYRLIAANQKPYECFEICEYAW